MLRKSNPTKMSTAASALVLCFVLIVSCSEAEPATEISEAPDGGTASLPCSLTPVHPPDKISVVLWYRASQESPIYKFDLHKSTHWADPSLGNRYLVRLIDESKAVMIVSPVKLEDEGLFLCRVDFLKTPTRITHVNLTVVVPPSNVQVSDGFGPLKNGLTTAFAEGASLTLICTATGGRPLPRVSWWLDGNLTTNETQYFPDKKKSLSILKIEKLTRSHLLAVYSCEVSNFMTNSSSQQPPLVVRVAIDMYLRPLEVTLTGNDAELSAGRKYSITCKCKGSRPPAVITWFKDGVPMIGGKLQVSPDGNTSTSMLTITPNAADHGLLLSCKAANQRIPFSEQQRTWMMRVLYPPRVALKLGVGLDPFDIKEGADVYFECHIVANPWVYRVWWMIDGERLLSNATSGVIVSNQTLVLQGVSRTSSGRYSCEATNKEGTSRSIPFHLKVKFEPVCGDGKRVLGAAKDEPLKVDCKVEAEPPATIFQWSFNSTPGISRHLTDFTTTAGSSILTYVPHENADYGTIHCIGQNKLGMQRQPCVYHIVPAGKPDPPHTCQVLNVTHHSVVVSCKRGFDGGLRQKFVLEVHTELSMVANMSSLTTPEFTITNLDPAQHYTASVVAYNNKGWSKYAQPIAFHTLASPGVNEQRMRANEPSESRNGGGHESTGPMMYILLAGGATLIVAGAVGVLVFLVRRFRIDSPMRERCPRSPKGGDDSPLNAILPPLYTDTISDDNNPDLIPPTNESLLDASMMHHQPYTITPRPSTKRNSATQMPVKPYHVTWAPILQSRNCSTQTPPPHKESSV